MSVIYTHLVLKLEDQDQTQDEDEVSVLVTIGNYLVERKGLKEGFIVTHQIKSITWVNQQIHFK